MPMHDWTKVEPAIYYDFHSLWLVAVRHALNNGLLPPTYYSMGEPVAAIGEADILTLQGPPPAGPPPAVGNGVHEVATDPPQVGILERAERAVRRRSGRRLTIRHVSNHRVVAVLEIVSPGNKTGRRDYAAFIRKAVDVLAAGIHLFIADPFPPPGHDPGGLHAAIWRRAAKLRKGRRPFTPPPDRPLAAISYSAGPEVLVAVQPLAVGEPVPSMPLFLEQEEYITVPLEETYATAWPEVPRVWREVLER